MNFYLSLLKKENNLNQVRNKIKQYLEFSHIYNPDEFSIISTLLYSITIYFVAQTVYLIVTFWEEWSFNLRVSAVESLNFTFGVIFLSSDLYLMPGKTKILMEMLKWRHHVKNHGNLGLEIDMLKEKLTFLEKMEVESVNSANAIKKVLNYVYLNYLLTPVFGLIFYFLKIINLDNLTLPFIIHIPTYNDPFKFENLRHFFLSASFLSIYIIYTAVLTITIFQVSFLSVNNVITEMQLLLLSLKEFNVNFPVGFDDGETGKLEENDRKNRLKALFNDICEHHQYIFRKIDILNDGYRYRLFYVNTFTCLQLCFALFCLQKGDLGSKVRYGLLSAAVILTNYVFSENGQRLENEGEKLREAFFDCSWIGKPHWLKSSLVILLTRMTKSPKIHSYGIFTLNKNNLKIVGFMNP
ncbi:uncharacterized protein LOC120353339 [Nilaparvata lugens]|uniref:uncharacterized protein LOC120353339 n=1 Tax=Nilaparvata lugens TaxID=108931 RepID=UPI00193DC382|nr:uncharacterized protein LOC120353339 [Nilaparvata lugens]